MTNFTCPKCSGKRIDEIARVTQTTGIKDISESGEIEYGDICCGEGKFSGYQCSTCGWVIPDTTDGPELLIALENIEEDRKQRCRNGIRPLSKSQRKELRAQRALTQDL